MIEKPYKSASEMLFDELRTNMGTDIVDRLMTKPPFYTLTTKDLVEAAETIKFLRADIQAYQKQVKILSDAYTRHENQLEAAGGRIYALSQKARMEDLWGKKCTEFESGCPSCEAWKQFEETEIVPSDLSSKNGIFCDECGSDVTNKHNVVVSPLPFDITSANKGESAVLCLDCLSTLETQNGIIVEPDSDPATGIPYGDLS